MPLVAAIALPTSELNAFSTALVIGDLLRVRGKHLIDDFLDFAAVGDLLQAHFFYIGIRLGFFPTGVVDSLTFS